MTAPREVLAAHTTLYERLKYPSALVRDFYGGFFTEEAFRGLQRDVAENGLMFSRWLQMLAPAMDQDEFLAMCARPLYGAPTYQVAADIVDAVTATYEASAGKGLRLQEADVPSPTGFVWLDKPALLTDAGGFSIATRAVSWGPSHIPADYLRGEWPSAGFRRDGIRLTTYSHVDDIDANTDPEMAERLRSVGMPLSISHSSFISYGTSFQSRVHHDEDVTVDDIIHWVHTLWMFMGTEIVGTERPQVERAFRRRAQRLIGVTDVNVVTLRRIRVGGHEVHHRDIDWSCRWVVQEHYRHLEEYSGPHPLGAVPLDRDKGCCAVCGKRITRVRAYVKGPDGLPLKAVPETVYRVAR